MGAVGAASKKKFRVATARLLQSLDYVLTSVTGLGFEGFSTRGSKVSMIDEPTHALISDFLTGPIRICTLAADQPSCGPAGVAFLSNANYMLGVDLLFDPPHRLWSSEKLGL